ncbi:MAG TPA: acyl-CoA dehydrogenase family protein, partial [Vicinamibacterales bacterium]|nr:acyl-CoA dehydrogenase family protein [Vicinamibacterales bacterium]
EFPLERMYRDARITRIYEGTNEINRMLVPTRLLKQWPQLFSAQAALAALEQSSVASQQSVSPQSSSPQSSLRGEREFVARLKRLAIVLLGQASATYGDALRDEQEVQAQIADIVIEAYATESGIARAEKLLGRGDSRANVALDIVRVYANDAADTVTAAARQVVAALSARGAGDSLACAAQKLVASAPIDAIAARRRIADAVIEAGKYPL